MAERKFRMALLSRYARHHKIRYGTRPDMNMNKEQWAADALIESYGLTDCYDLLEYYFDTASSPNWNFFAYSADRIIESKKRLEEDLKEREQRKRMAKEWLNG